MCESVCVEHSSYNLGTCHPAWGHGPLNIGTFNSPQLCRSKKDWPRASLCIIHLYIIHCATDPWSQRISNSCSSLLYSNMSILSSSSSSCAHDTIHTIHCKHSNFLHSIKHCVSSPIYYGTSTVYLWKETYYFSYKAKHQSLNSRLFTTGHPHPVLVWVHHSYFPDSGTPYSCCPGIAALVLISYNLKMT